MLIGLLVCFHCPIPILRPTPRLTPMWMAIIVIWRTAAAEPRLILIPIPMATVPILAPIYRYQYGRIYLFKEWELSYRPVVGITKQARSGSMEATIIFLNKIASVHALHRNHHWNWSQWSTSAYYQNWYNNQNRNQSQAVETHHFTEKSFVKQSVMLEWEKLSQKFWFTLSIIWGV